MSIERAKELIKKAQKSIRHEHAGGIYEGSSFAEEKCDTLLTHALAELYKLKTQDLQQTKASHGQHLCSVCGGYISKDEDVIIGVIIKPAAIEKSQSRQNSKI